MESSTMTLAPDGWLVNSQRMDLSWADAARAARRTKTKANLFISLASFRLLHAILDVNELGIRLRVARIRLVRDHLAEDLELVLRRLPVREVDRLVGKEPLVLVTLLELRLGPLESALELVIPVRLRVDGIKVEDRLAVGFGRSAQIAVLDLAVFPLGVADGHAVLGHLRQLLAGILNRPDAELVAREGLERVADGAKRIRFLRVLDRHILDLVELEHADAPALERILIRRARARIAVLELRKLGILDNLHDALHRLFGQLRLLVDMAIRIGNVVELDAQDALPVNLHLIPVDARRVGLDLLVAKAHQLRSFANGRRQDHRRLRRPRRREDEENRHRNHERRRDPEDVGDGRTRTRRAAFGGGWTGRL